MAVVREAVAAVVVVDLLPVKLMSVPAKPMAAKVARIPVVEVPETADTEVPEISMTEVSETGMAKVPETAVTEVGKMAAKSNGNAESRVFAVVRAGKHGPRRHDGCHKAACNNTNN